MTIRHLSPELAEKARELFQEDPEKLQHALQQVRDWLAVQPHLNARTDDQWLAAYIRGCKFDLEKVRKKMDLYYTCRHTASELNQMHHKDEKFKELINYGAYLPLPKLSDPAAPRVYLVRTGVLNILEFGIVNAFAAANIINKILMVDDDNAIISGNIVIADLKDTNLLHMLELNSSQMKMILASKQGGFPLTSTTMFCINVPQQFSVLLNMMKLFGERAAGKNMMYMYTDDYEEMYTKHRISKEIMPVEYGGNGGTLKEITDHWKKKIEEYSDWLEEDRRFGTDETKRLGAPMTAENMFGNYVLKSMLQVVDEFYK